MFEKILVCLDGSKLSEQIIPYAAEQADRFNSELTLLQVLEIPGYALRDGANTPSRIEEIARETVLKLEAETKEYMDKLARPLRERNIKARIATIMPKAPGKAILEYASENNIDLICIATHGRSGLNRLVFGSVAEHVLRNSSLPLLLIKPAQD
ncbi:MAG: universal stress protein [Dehalococcoidaceae bacterium]|nr:universal stress protein [Dehalococcoidaceae bacterium]